MISRTVLLVQAELGTRLATQVAGGSRLCTEGADCRWSETIHALLLLVGLCIAILMVICAFAFFREDKEEQITPLCPQLVVREPDLGFRLPLDSLESTMQVTDLQGRVRCRVVMDFAPKAKGVAATAWLQNAKGSTLASIVARSPSIPGQGLALCRASSAHPEIFGFVEPEGEQRYHVRHRTGVHLLTLKGDFDTLDIEGINPVGLTVCSFKRVRLLGEGGAVFQCNGRVLQYVDAGLVICSLLATHVHRRLTSTLAALASPPPSSSLDQTPRTRPVSGAGRALATAAAATSEEEAEAATEVTADGGSTVVTATPGAPLLFRGVPMQEPSMQPPAAHPQRAASEAMWHQQ